MTNQYLPIKPGVETDDVDNLQLGWVGEVYDDTLGYRRYQTGKCATAVSFANALVAMNYSDGTPLNTFQYTSTISDNIWGVIHSALSTVTASYATMVTVEGDAVPVAVTNASTIAAGDYVRPSSTAGKVVSAVNNVGSLTDFPAWRCVRSAVSGTCYIALRKLV